MTVFVAGGTKGIGLAIARRLATPGRHVFLNYHSDDDAAQRAGDGIRAGGAIPHLVKSDVSSLDGAREAMEEVRKFSDHVDVLVHSAAIPNPGGALEISEEQLMSALQSGGIALWYLVKAFDPLLKHGSSVIFLSGRSVDQVLPQHAALGSAKAWGECLIRYLAIEMGSRGVRFNTLRTGPVDTELLRSIRGAHADDGWSPNSPLGRPLELDDIASVAEFLVSSQAFMIQGQTVTVDGGLAVVG